MLEDRDVQIIIQASQQFTSSFKITRGYKGKVVQNNIQISLKFTFNLFQNNKTLAYY